MQPSSKNAPKCLALAALLSSGLAGVVTANPIELLPHGAAGTQQGALAFSGDGRSVYVTAGSLWEFQTYSRDPVSGALSSQALLSLVGTDDVVVSPDDAHVYVAQGALIRVFSRDPLAGALSALPDRELPAGSGPCALAGSPDGAFVHAACDGSDELLSFARDDGSGALAAPTAVDASDPRDLALPPDGAHAYVPSFDGNALSVYERDGASGALTLLDTYLDGEEGVSGLVGAHEVAVTPDGAGVYALGGNGFHVTVAGFDRDPVSGLLTFVEQHELPGHAAHVAASDAAVWLVVMTGSFDYPLISLLAFTRDTGTNQLELADEAPVRFTTFFSGSTGGIGLAPDGEQVIVSGAFEGISAARMAPDTSLFEPVQTLVDGEGGVTGLAGARKVVTTPDGRHVVVLSGEPGRLAVFARDAQSGSLAFGAVESDGLGDPLALVTSPAGDFVYVADAANGLVRYARDGATGALSLAEATSDGLGGEGARVLALSPDGASLYAGGDGTGGVARYTRDPGTGALAYQGTASTSPPAPQQLAVSDDGGFLYAQGGDGLFVAPRDPSSGALGEPAEADEPVNGFALPSDAEHLYLFIAYPLSPLGFSVYSADPTTGVPDVFVATVDTPVMSSDPQPVGLTDEAVLSPDGRFLHLLGPRAFAVFARDRTTGALTLADAHQGPTTSAATSADGAHLYVVAEAGELRVYVPEPDATAASAIALATTWLLAARRSRRTPVS